MTPRQKPGELSYRAPNKIVVSDDALLALYLGERLSAAACAHRLGLRTPSPIYRRLAELGVTRDASDAATGVLVGPRNPNWGGGSCLDGQGYVLLSVNGRQRREHRIVMERILGRPLWRKEVVHHKNGDRADNRPENLELHVSQSEHMRHHMTSEEASRRALIGRDKRRALRALGVEVQP